MATIIFYLLFGIETDISILYCLTQLFNTFNGCLSYIPLPTLVVRCLEVTVENAEAGVIFTFKARGSRCKFHISSNIWKLLLMSPNDKFLRSIDFRIWTKSLLQVLFFSMFHLLIWYIAVYIGLKLFLCCLNIICFFWCSVNKILILK